MNESAAWCFQAVTLSRFGTRGEGGRDKRRAVSRPPRQILSPEKNKPLCYQKITQLKFQRSRSLFAWQITPVGTFQSQSSDGTNCRAKPPPPVPSCNSAYFTSPPTPPLPKIEPRSQLDTSEPDIRKSTIYRKEPPSGICE